MTVEPTYEVKGYSEYRKDWYYSRGQSSSTFGGGRERGRFNRGGQQNTNWRNPPNDPWQTNPLNPHDNISWCGICQSIFHWDKECTPNSSGETLNLAVLGSGCTKTMCGEEWLNCYLDTSSEKEQKKTQFVKSGV